MAVNDTERRRFLMATMLTLLALPALWWVNRTEESAAPNVAVAGAADIGAEIDAGLGHGATDPPAEGTADGSTPAAATTATTVAPDAIPDPAAPPAPDSPGDEPVFLAGPSGTVGAGLAQIAVPAPPDGDRTITSARFRTNNLRSNGCLVPGMLSGNTITVVNLDNGRRVRCTTVATRGELGDEITLATALFAEIADLTESPIPVEFHR